MIKFLKDYFVLLIFVEIKKKKLYYRERHELQKQQQFGYGTWHVLLKIKCVSWKEDNFFFTISFATIYYLECFEEFSNEIISK